MGLGLSHLVFHPPKPTYSPDSNLIWLITETKNRIPAFHIYRSSEKFTILFSHGNAEDIGMVASHCKTVAAAWDVNIFAYEYSGYGCASGRPSEKNVYDDIQAAYNYLTQHLKISSSKVILYGRSLGTGASVHLAASYLVGGVILQSALLSVHRVAGLNFKTTLPGDMFCNTDKISKIQSPVFFIHGVQDDVVPFYHGIGLYNACPTAVTPYWIENAGHNNIERRGKEEFLLSIANFIKYLGKLQRKEQKLKTDKTKKFVSKVVTNNTSVSELKPVSSKAKQHKKALQLKGNCKQLTEDYSKSVKNASSKSLLTLQEFSTLQKHHHGHNRSQFLPYRQTQCDEHNQTSKANTTFTEICRDFHTSKDYDCRRNQNTTHCVVSQQSNRKVLSLNKHQSLSDEDTTRSSEQEKNFDNLLVDRLEETVVPFSRDSIIYDKPLRDTLTRQTKQKRSANGSPLLWDYPRGENVNKEETYRAV